MTKEEEIRWRKASRDAVLKALREAGEEQRQRRLKEQSEEEAIYLKDHPFAELFARILPPSEDILRTNRALSEKPLKRPTVEEARKQVREHLQQAAEEMSRHGHGKKID